RAECWSFFCSVVSAAAMRGEDQDASATARSDRLLAAGSRPRAGADPVSSPAASGPPAALRLLVLASPVSPDRGRSAPASTVADRAALRLCGHGGGPRRRAAAHPRAAVVVAVPGRAISR